MNPQPLHIGGMPQGALRPHASVMASAVVPGANGASLVRSIGDDETYTDMALAAGDMGSGLAAGTLGKFGGAVGTAASGAFSVVGTSIQQQRAVEKLLEVYRDTVSAQLQIPPAAVNEMDLRAAADQFAENKALRDEFERMDTRSVTSPVRAVVTSAAALAGGAAGAIAGGGIASLATGFAGSVAASSAAGKALDGIIGKEDALTPFVALQQAEAKVLSGEGVSPKDMFLFHVASDPALAAQIEGHMGDRFQDLPAEKQARAMLRDHPVLTELCKYEAYMLNSKAVPAASLMDGRVQQSLVEEFEQTYAQVQRPAGRIMTAGAEISPLAPRSQIVLPDAGGEGAFARAVTQRRIAAPVSDGPAIN